MAKLNSKTGFTLIELSIVLVIIGLIVGGVLVGRDLIKAAEMRAQVTQIEKLKTAVGTFQGKYNNYLPGDIPEPNATNFGFTARGQFQGQGDGNSILEGNFNNASGTYAFFVVTVGETAMFWGDLSRAKLIDQMMTAASSTTNPGALPFTVVTRYFPSAAIGADNFLIAYSYDAVNYVSIAKPLYSNGSSQLVTAPALKVSQAHAIDKKIDDGFPQTGALKANYLYTFNLVWAAGGGVAGAADTSATASSSTTCFDNTNVGGAVQQYSMTQNNGAGVNCALSFKFQ